MIFSQKVALFQIEADTKEEVLSLLANALREKACVTDQFLSGILAREQEYPTGLPTNPVGIAVPHTDADKVNEAQIAFASLKNPVKFCCMTDKDMEIDVSLVFMLALKNPDDQVQMLQTLVGLMQNETIVLKLLACEDMESFIEIIKGAGLIE